jgi:hypothetical protein
MASAEVGPSTGMNKTTILAGCLREVQPEAIILAAGTRIALPPDLSAKDVPVGASVLVTVTRSERGEWTARRIEHEPRRNARGKWSPQGQQPPEGGSSPSGGGGPLLWPVALLPPSPLEGVSQHRPHVPALLAHPRKPPPTSPTASTSPTARTQNRGTCAIRRRSLTRSPDPPAAAPTGKSSGRAP